MATRTVSAPKAHAIPPKSVAPAAALEPIGFGIGEARYMADPASPSSALLVDPECMLCAANDTLQVRADEVKAEHWGSINLIDFCVGIVRELSRREGVAA